MSPPALYQPAPASYAPAPNAPAPGPYPYGYPMAPMPGFPGYPGMPITYGQGPSTVGQKTEGGVRVLMYSFLVGAMASIAAGVSGFAPGSGSMIAAVCFVLLLGGISLLMGLVGVVRIYGDRTSFGDEHARSVRLAILLYVIGFIGLLATGLYNSASIPEAQDAVRMPGFTYASVIPQRAAVALMSVAFTTLTIYASFLMLRNLQPSFGMSVLKVAVFAGIALEAGVSFGQLGVYIAAVPQLDAALAARGVTRVDAILTQYYQEIGLLGMLGIFSSVLFAYAAYIVLQHFPVLREKFATRGPASGAMPFGYPYPMHPMVPYGMPPPSYPAPYQAPPPPAPPASPLTIVPVSCPRCQRPAEFIGEYSRYYCRHCSAYV